MTDRTWIVAEPAPKEFIDAHPEFPSLVLHILWHRGLRTEEDLLHFMHPNYDEDLHDPFLFRDMRTAVDRMLGAIKRQERMTVYGDYDADGVTATATMVEVLSALGAQVDWYLPERLAEGYGLHTEAIERLAKQGTTLLITVDCGSTNVAEIARANELGMEVIVIDHHHQPEEIPAAHAILNPVFSNETYPFKGHSSGGVAFKVACALLQASQYGVITGHPLTAGWEKWLLDLTAVSTVADMMTLRGENRAFVKYGLLTLRKTRRPGLRALFGMMGSDLARADEYSIGFQVAPRINAAGRLQHASTALNLLLTRHGAEAKRLAGELHQINTDRQKLTELAVAEALEQIEAQGDQAAYAAFAPHWSPGILGLIAGRLVERVWRPVVVMTDNNGDIVGSGRSIPGFDIMQVMDAGKEHFRRFGGHPGACGFTLYSSGGRSKFQDWFSSHVGTQLRSQQLEKPMHIDAEATLSDFDAATLDQLEELAPFGMDHPRPKFLLRNITITALSTTGLDKKHLKLNGSQGDRSAKFIGFRFGDRIDRLRIGDRLDLVVEAGWNVWNGQKEQQLKIIDMEQSDV